MGWPGTGGTATEVINTERVWKSVSDISVTHPVHACITGLFDGDGLLVTNVEDDVSVCLLLFDFIETELHLLGHGHPGSLVEKADFLVGAFVIVTGKI